MSLLPEHRAHLRTSGLSDETIDAAGISSLSPRQTAALGYPRGLSGIGFPYLGTAVNIDGNTRPYTRLRVDASCRRSPGQKYENPLKSRLSEGLTFYPYLPPGVDGLRKKGREAVFVTEGEKKALKLTQEGFPAIGLPGVFMFVDPTSKKHPAEKPLHPELRRWRWRKRTVYVCFDSDRIEKDAVAIAHERLCAALTRAGAQVLVVNVPALDGMEKTGADDFLVSEGVEAFQELVDGAEKWEPFAWILELLPDDLPTTAIGSALEGARRILRGLNRAERRSLARGLCHRYPDLSLPEALEVLAGEPGDGDDLPEIVVNGRQLRDVVSDAWRALRRSSYGPRLFHHSLGVALVERESVHAVDVALMSALLNRSASWVAIKKEDQLVDARLPQEVPRDMLALPSPELPGLTGMSRLPVIQPDGSLSAVQGYDAASKLYVLTDARVASAVASVPNRPTAAQRDQALKWLESEVLVDFPFARPSDRANALGLLLLPLVRHLIAGPTPLHLIEAPSEGTGKTLLASGVALLAEGRGVLPTSLPQREGELRKKLTSLLMAAPGLVLLDNITGALDSESLAAVLTSVRWSDRLLGQSKMVALPNRAIWMATANNPVLSREIARRTVRIRLDADMERPWLREGFRHPDLLGWLGEHRAEVVARLLVLVRAWMVVGKPQGAARLGSFNGWARLVGGILGVAGVSDFLGDRHDDVEVSDPEEEEWSGFVGFWAERFGEDRVSSRELMALAVELELFSLSGSGVDARERSRFSRALGKRRDRRYPGGRICVTHDRKRKQNLYFLNLTGQG